LNRLYSKARPYVAEQRPAHGTRWVRALCCLSLITALLAGCDVNVGGKQRPILRHDRIQGEVELTAERRTDKQSTNGNNRKSESNVFEERVRLKTQGDVYHPDFLFFNAALGMGLAQQQLWIDGDYDTHGEWLNDYNVFAQLLRAKSYPTTFYATRSEELISRQFLGALRTQRENRGATMSLRSEDWPMTFQYTTSKSNQDDLTPPATDFFARDDRRFRYSATHSFGDWSHVSFDFDRTEVSQRSPGALVETDTDQYTVLHDLLFGSDRQHRLDSFLSYVDQSGTFNFENVQVEERLKLQHTDNFLTNYKLRFAKYQREDIGNKEIRAEAGLQHRLYESLVTTANVFTSKTDLETQGNLTQRGGVLGLNYRKNNPWGILLSSYTASLNQSDQSGGTDTGVVIGESHTATELVPVELDRVNIDVSTIRVKDSTGLLYQEGEDYTITERNGRVWLNIITVGGAIPPNFTEGQEFFVDYNFFIEPKRREDTLRQNFTVRERLDNGFSVYYAHRRQDDKVSSTVTVITPDEYTINTVGADYSNKGLFLQAEYSDENSTQIPSTSRKLEGRYSWPINPDTSASVQVLNQWLDFGAPESRGVALFRSGAEVFSRLTDKYGISARADYRNENDTRFGATKGFQFTSEFQYNIRQLSLVAGVEFNTLSRRNDKIDGSFLYLRLKRFF
jgi:hypothetical protein